MRSHQDHSFVTQQPDSAISAKSPWNFAGAWPATITTCCATALLIPLACSQFGKVGAVWLGVFAAAIVTSTWASALIAVLVAVKYPKLSALASSSGIRMIAPLIVAVVVAAAGGRLAPVETLYYLVPLFMCSLAADAASHIRELRQANPSAVSISAAAPSTRGAV
jgi:uncharacterized membrane protein YfcA